MNILALLLAFLCLVLGMIIDGNLSSFGQIILFFDLPSFLFVGGISLFFTLAHHSFESGYLAHQLAFSSEPLSFEETQPHLSVLTTLRSLYIGAGGIGLVIGLIKMLANMDDPNSLGPAVAVALLPLFYGMILAELMTRPLINRIQSLSYSSAKVKGDES